MNNVKFIAFSGGCFSGKTTTMNLLKDKLIQNGIHVIVINENIRDFITSRNTTIEAMRKDANAYFQLQYEIISDKMSKELRVLRTKKDNQPFQNTIVLADRSMIDSCLLCFRKFLLRKMRKTFLDVEIRFFLII